ncbi:MAG: hypothetical protein QOC81_3335 [Thermoanaerobaculia bacterium]|jgi:hypothetical protein|nr:hypothetical protein [Thermoanaerobaculia bacterium]
MIRLRALPLLALLLASTNLAADDAGGTFHYGKSTFKIVNAVAYQRDSSDPKKPVTVVLAADFKIDVPALVAALDPTNALVAQVARNERGNFVRVTLADPNRCGIWAFLDTGKQVELSDNYPARTTASSASRITGECSTSKPEKTLFGDEYEFHLAYDLPITPIAKPASLPAGGGEPGHAFVALIDAIRAGDWDASHLHLREDDIPSTKPAPSDKKHFFEGLALNYPKSATVAGGLIKGDQAQLQISGASYDGSKIKGDIAMKRVAGNWRVVDMSLYGDQ